MIRTRRPLQPAIETAEARLLTSVAGAAIHAPHAHVQADAAPRPLHLQLRGTFEVRANFRIPSDYLSNDRPIFAKLTGSASLPPLGPARIVGLGLVEVGRGLETIHHTSPDYLTLADSGGRIALNVTSIPYTGKYPRHVPFVIEGGTGAYRGATGGGQIAFTLDGKVKDQTNHHGDEFFSFRMRFHLTK